MYYVKRFLDYIFNLVGYKREMPQPEQPSQPVVVKQRKKRTPFYTYDDGEKSSFPSTLSDLLDSLKKMFEVIQLPTAMSWIPADERVAFVRLGIYVPHPWEMRWVKYGNPVCVDNTKILPAMMAVAFPHNDSEKHLCPHILFCFKLNKLPYGVQPLKGHPYRVGAVYNLDGKLIWMTMHIVIDPETGEITTCREAKQAIVDVGDKHRTRYNKKWSGDPSLIDSHDPEKYTKDEYLHTYKVTFKSVFDWWVGRRTESWNVSVKKNNRKLTFSIGRAETKRYFADRDKTVNKKKIIHYVTQHQRMVRNKSITIKEHLRGLDTFSWNGYDCKVTAPKFSDVTSVIFQIPGIEVDETNIERGKFVGAKQLAEILSNNEERRFK